MKLLAGDILLIKRKGLIAALIRRFSGPNWWTPGVVNHAAMMINSYQAIETGRKVRVVPLSYYTNGPEVAIFTRISITANERKALSVAGLAYASRFYGFAKIATHLLDWLCGGVYFFRRLTRDNRYPICSWIVAQAYAHLGIKFGVEPEAADPDDIWRHLTEGPGRYTFRQIHPLQKLTFDEISLDSGIPPSV